jgi:hypothetical protein
MGKRVLPQQGQKCVTIDTNTASVLLDERYRKLGLAPSIGPN